MRACTDMAGLRRELEVARRAAGVGAQNFAAADVQDLRATEGIDRVKMHTMFRYAMIKVMRENHIDVFVHPNIGLPLGKIGHAQSPTPTAAAPAASASPTCSACRRSSCRPASTTSSTSRNSSLSDDKKSYTGVAGTTASKVPHPLPFSIEFWAAPGDEPVILKVASAYEAATHHRKPPAAFPALPASAGTRTSRAER